ncbi:CCA tRNA nucleotidyltransferase [Romboutsia weinsteinii]|uniref:CCA tRNA nucleotidyltransferase n=1 Tax=Romboutsia weinsteinii TaxID=2020949 RepID=A0A371J7H9_9FIRM|nr:CCA tRNA nucleotidyltransferase [Romboutsia weinsteinii]RDY28741.1 CCA tRNA nucleotidyltransferase [Romboutsia weinsteinii]
MKIRLPKKVKYIIDKIYDEGYEAFIVGGCVRDSILGIEPNDYDITTSAKPNDIMNIFKGYKIIDNGIKHGTVAVVVDKDIYEITTYRVEGEYEDNRRPKSVEFTSNIKDDLQRRDFTINAIAYNDKIGLVDNFNGLIDIKNKIVKTVGDPDERFNEDGLRIVRAIRFSSKLGFQIEKETLNSIYKNANIIKNISIERITEEFTKTILSDNPEKIILLYKTGIMKYLDIDSDINEESLKILRKCDKTLEDRLTILEYISIVKAKCNLCIDSKKNSVLNTLKYSNKLNIKCNIILEYMFIDLNDMNTVKIKQMLNKIGQDNLKKSLILKKIYSRFYLEDNTTQIDNIINEIDRIQNDKECYCIKDLDINGEILKELGYRGKDIGEKLNLLLNKVINNPKLNTRENLIGLL